MGFWGLKRKASESMEEKAARRAARAQRDQVTYDAIMAAFVQPLPTFSQWTAAVPRGQPPTYEHVASSAAYHPATFYPNQSYENPYGYHYSPCPSTNGFVTPPEPLPSYVDTTYYNPYARQVCSDYTVSCP